MSRLRSPRAHLVPNQYSLTSARRLLVIVAVALWLALSAFSAMGGSGSVANNPPPPPGFQSESDLVLPDLITLPPSDLRLVGDSRSAHRLLRFTNTVANAGPGVLELTGTLVPEDGTYRVRQHLFAWDGSRVQETLLPEIIFHPGHDHWHLADFARYELWSVRPDGSIEDIVSVQGKVSYCMIDTDRWTVSERADRNYSGCVPTLQGLSVGWADSYESDLDGQSLDVAGLPNGLYALRSVADPNNHLIEIDEYNNDNTVLLRLTGNHLQVGVDLLLTWDRLSHVSPEN